MLLLTRYRLCGSYGSLIACGRATRWCNPPVRDRELAASESDIGVAKEVLAAEEHRRDTYAADAETKLRDEPAKIPGTDTDTTGESDA